MNRQKYFVLDVALCSGCNNCFMACKDEHVGNSWLPYTDEQPRHGHRWVDIKMRERGQFPRIDVAYLPVMCQQCEDAPCASSYPDIVHRREDGVVLIDVEKARGNRALADSCPYGAIWWNEEANVAQKCTMCAHILDSGEEPRMPRCAHSCPTGALGFKELAPEEVSALEEEGFETYLAELGTGSHVLYKNLFRFAKDFIAGGVVADGECAEGVEVVLRGVGIERVAATDCFGDFMFDDLEPGKYVLEIEGKEVKSVNLSGSMNVGEISI